MWVLRLELYDFKVEKKIKNSIQPFLNINMRKYAKFSCLKNKFTLSSSLFTVQDKIIWNSSIERVN